MFLAKNKEIINSFNLKIIVFTPVINCCILHGRVFVMYGICGPESKGSMSIIVLLYKMNGLEI